MMKKDPTEWRKKFDAWKNGTPTSELFNLSKYDEGTDDKTYLPEYEYEATVTPQGTSLEKHKRITNEEDWQKYWGNVGAGYVNKAQEAVAVPTLKALKEFTYFTPIGAATSLGDAIAAHMNGGSPEEILSATVGALPEIRFANNAGRFARYANVADDMIQINPELLQRLQEGDFVTKRRFGSAALGKIEDVLRNYKTFLRQGYANAKRQLLGTAVKNRKILPKQVQKIVDDQIDNQHLKEYWSGPFAFDSFEYHPGDMTSLSYFNMTPKQVMGQAMQDMNDIPVGSRFLVNNLSTDSYPLVIHMLDSKISPNFKLNPVTDRIVLNGMGNLHGQAAVDRINKKLQQLEIQRGMSLGRAKRYVSTIGEEQITAPFLTAERLYDKGKSIYISPANKGKFNDTKKRNGTDDKTYLPEYEYEATVTPQGTSLEKHKRITNEEDWQKYWGNVGAGYVNKAQEAAAPVVLNGMSMLMGNPLGALAGIVGSEVGSKLGAKISPQASAIGGLAGGFLGGVDVTAYNRALPYLYNEYKTYKLANAINRAVKENPIITGYNRNPALKDIGDLWNYQNYLKQAYPNTQIKDVVWHGSRIKDLQNFSTEAIGSNTPIKGSVGMYLTPYKFVADSYGKRGGAYPVLLNSENPYITRQIFALPRNGVNVARISPKVKNTVLANNDAVVAPQRGEIAFFNPNNALILGSKPDMLAFSRFARGNKPNFDPNELFQKSVNNQHGKIISDKDLVDAWNRIYNILNLDKKAPTKKIFDYLYSPILYDKGKSIRINPANKGKFNATKKRTGKTTEQLAHSKNPLTRKRAVFALNSRKFKH